MHEPLLCFPELIIGRAGVTRSKTCTWPSPGPDAPKTKRPHHAAADEAKPDAAAVAAAEREQFKYIPSE